MDAFFKSIHIRALTGNGRRDFVVSFECETKGQPKKGPGDGADWICYSNDWDADHERHGTATGSIRHIRTIDAAVFESDSGNWNRVYRDGDHPKFFRHHRNLADVIYDGADHLWNCDSSHSGAEYWNLYLRAFRGNRG